jgi:uncharacterized protein DUF6316
MAEKRKDDPLERTWFRTDRIVQDGGKWFFMTREGPFEGPFDCRLDALQRLETYTKVVNTGIIEQDYKLHRRLR